MILPTLVQFIARVLTAVCVLFILFGVLEFLLWESFRLVRFIYHRGKNASRSVTSRRRNQVTR